MSSPFYRTCISFHSVYTQSLNNAASQVPPHLIATDRRRPAEHAGGTPPQIKPRVNSPYEDAQRERFQALLAKTDADLVIVPCMGTDGAKPRTVMAPRMS